MAQSIVEVLRGYLVHHGYLAVVVALLLENAGVPVPGETVLLLASYLAYSQHQLHLSYVIVVGICAATVGDNIGFAIGHYGGRPLLTRYWSRLRFPVRALARGERLFQRYGAATIFFARFVFGMRVIAGPLAGVLRMPWWEFVIFNLMGAALWVTTIATVGYLFGRHWELLMHYVKRADIALVLLALLVVLFLWWRQRNLAAVNEK